MIDFITNVFQDALYYTAPLLITALGGLFSERSGVVNIGLEGLMVIGNFVAALFIVLTYDSMGYSAIWLGLLLGTLAGGIFSLLHAYASITLKANQVISGTAIIMLASAISVYVARAVIGTQNVQIKIGVTRGVVPVLSQIPIIGPLLFTKAYLTTFIILLLLLILWFLLYKTPFGLRLRACGEHPHAADSMGINVIKMRYIGVIMSGLLAGLGGATVLVTYSGQASGSVNGLGFLALAALIFGKWHPWKVLFASFFFGFMKTAGTIARLSSLNIPQEIFQAFPYIMTLVALVLFSKNATGPKAAGEPYDPGKR